MLVYLGIYFVLVIAGLSISDRKSTPFLVFTGFFLLWFMGLRYEVGCDFTGYLSRYVNIESNLDIWSIFSYTEPFFQALVAGVTLAELPYYWVNVFASAIIVVCLILFLRTHRSPVMILALLFPIIILQLSMSGIRQALALSFLLLASVYFVRGSRIWTGLAIIVGMQFHTSVVAFLPLAFLAGSKVSTSRLVIAMMVLGPIAVWLMGDRFDVYSDRYIAQIYGESESGGAVIRYILILIPAAFFLAYKKRVAQNFPEVYQLLKLFTLISFALLPLLFVSTVALHRLTYYVMPFSILSFVYLSLVIFPKSQRQMGRVLPALVYGTYTLSWFLLSTHAEYCYIPYQNYIFLPAY